MKYLLDTDWVIDHLHGVDKVIKRLEELAPEGLAISVLSLAELYEGVFYSTEPEANERALARFLEGIELLGVDNETCRIFGRERGMLRSEGLRIGDFDLLIGATALQHNLTLLSNNRRHFAVIKGLEIISL